MRSSQTTHAIVLRARPYGESDKIVSFLTEDFGKLSGIAKGALRSRRRFVNSLEPFSLVKEFAAIGGEDVNPMSKGFFDKMKQLFD